MSEEHIRKIWVNSYADYKARHPHMPSVQARASSAILNCKTGTLGVNVCQCGNCGHIEIHNNSCRNRNCPECQAVQKEVWVDRRRAEVIDAPYFHVVFTLPHELNPLVYCNQRLLYGLLHKCTAETLLELSRDKKYLGAVPGIIQVLHTWNQEMGYHVHMHCIVSGGGITPDRKLRTSKASFFIPVHVLRDKFKGKFLAKLQDLYENGKLVFSNHCIEFHNSYNWDEFRDSLYKKDWCPYIKETFNGFGNAIEYLGRYTNKIAISNSRIISITDTHTTFSARGRKPGDPRRQITLDNGEFIRRYLMHVLPSGFQKIRYYGFLNNRTKSANLKLIFTLQGHQRFRSRFINMTTAGIIQAVWHVDIHCCPQCGKSAMYSMGRTFSASG